MSDAFHPRPSVSLWIATLAVLAGCGAMTALSISWLFVTWDPCAIISGFILLPVPIAFGLQQYRGTFHRNSGAALAVAIISLGLSAFALFGFVANLGEQLVEGERVLWTALLPMLGVAGAFCFVGWLNLSWRNRLVRGMNGASNARFPWNRLHRDLIAGFAAVVCVAGLTTHFIRSTAPRFAVDVSRDHAPFNLPEGASDVSYCLGHRGTVACEFTIDEAGFVAWVESGIGSPESQSADVQLEPIGGAYRIKRYFYLAPGVEGPESAEISDGLRYSWSKEDRGVYAAFDRVTGRAYYFAHYH